ncbi:MAG: lipoprotein-releasing system permease protein [Cellvibrionaceae bacterium]|jgi:lipoprotein-releasing system permease protein
MRWPLSGFIGLRYTLTLKRNHFVSFISAIAMIGIVLGVALLITVLSVMNGFDRELKERILNIMPHVTLYQQDGIKDWRSVRQQLMRHDRITGAAPFVELQAMLHRGEATQPVLIYGVGNEFENTVSSIGKYLRDDTLEQLNTTGQGLALGRGLAEKLSLETGDSVTLIVPASNRARRIPTVRRLQVIDIFETATELDHRLALSGLDYTASLTQHDSSVTGLHIRLDDLFAAAEIAANLRADFPPGYYTSDWTRTHGNIYYAIGMSKNLVSLLLFLVIAIAAFNVVSTLVMVVIDKQSDIAVLRTLGMDSWAIMATFMVQGTVIGCLGTFFGVTLGIGLSLSIETLVAGLESLLGIRFLESDIYPVSFLPSSLQTGDVMLVAGISLAMSILATLYPARKAAKVQPAEALRYD